MIAQAVTELNNKPCHGQPPVSDRHTPFFGGVHDRQVNHFREALQAVNTGDKDILKPPVFKLGQHAEPEICTFIFCQPHAKKLFLTFCINAQREENGFVCHTAVLPDFDNNTVHINNSVHDQPHTSDKKFVQISLKYLSRKYKYRCAVLVITKLIFKSIRVNLNFPLKSNG